MESPMFIPVLWMLQRHDKLFSILQDKGIDKIVLRIIIDMKKGQK